MYEKTIKTENGTLYYTTKEDRVTISNYHGNDEKVVIPREIEGLPVRKIGKKAFMNAKRLKKVVLPDSTKKIAEWAFAYCKMLREIELPKRKIAFGTEPFLGDSRLETITMICRKKDSECRYGQLSDKEREDAGRLLAAVPDMADSSHLLNVKDAASKDWYKQLDTRILKLIDEADDKGYTDMILCGEEDINCNLDTYITNKRKRKVKYCFLRLLHNSELDDEVKTRLDDYLISHAVGCPSMETWLYLRDDMGHLKDYYEYYVNVGCLTDDNFDLTIADLQDKQPEMKAYFLRWREEKRGESADFFSGFEL